MLAFVLSREQLSMRMIAVGAMLVLLALPEAMINPGFQMSFASVIAIVSLHSSAPMRAWGAPREEPLRRKWSRQLAMLLVTGVVIELALMPIGLFHSHRVGIYGALANVIAIPVTTVASMPLIALALRSIALVREHRSGGWRASRSSCCSRWRTGRPACPARSR